MVPSKRKKHKRGVFDVQKTASFSRFEKIVHHFKRPHVLNLRPKLREKHPVIASGILLVLVFVMILGAKKIFTRGEIADFYAATCLGTWQNPQQAQGEPETFGADASSTPNSVNSAVFSGTTGDIFCGGFVPPDFETKGDIKNVGLTFVWRIEGIPSSTPEVKISPVDSGVDTSTSSRIQTPPADIGTSPTSTSVSTSTEEVPQSDSSSTTYFLNRKSQLGFSIFNRAFAEESGDSTVAPLTDDLTISPAPDVSSSAPPDQEVSSSETTSSALPVTQDSSSSSDSSAPVIIIAPPIRATLESATTTDVSFQDIVSSTTEVILPPPAPDDSFLSVSYSTDGQNWIDIQKVNVENFENFTVNLPIGNWDDVKNLQIRIKGIPTVLASQPTVYLDGMLIEAHYELPPILSEDQPTSQDSQTLTVPPNVSIQIPARKVVTPVPAPEIVSLDKHDGHLHVKLNYVGPFFGQSMNVFLYPAHTKSKRSGAKDGFGFVEESGGSFLDSVQLFQKDFAATGSTEFDIIAPQDEVNPDTGIAAESVIPGSYYIDIAYFDSQDWHLTKPYGFVWP